MPVFDWLHLILPFKLEDGSNALYYNEAAIKGTNPVSLVEDYWTGSKGFIYLAGNRKGWL